jgi:hypothetical protein
MENTTKNIDRDVMKGYSLVLNYYDNFPNKVKKNRHGLDKVYSELREIRESLSKDNPDYAELQGFEKKLKHILMRDLVSKIKNGELI